MKKILALLMAITLLFSLCACKKDGDVLSNNESDVTETVEFVKPEDYATVIGLKINPEFELYLDKEDNLLALNAVNEDAKAMEKDIDLSKKDLASVVSAIITKTDESGYLKSGGYMVFKAIQVLDSNINSSKILKKANDSAKDTLDKLNIDFDVNIEEGTDDTVSETSSKQDTSSKQETSSKTEDADNKEETSSKNESADNSPKEPTVVNPKTNIKVGKEYVGNKYSVEDENTITAGGICIDDSAIVILLSANFVVEGYDPNMPTDRTPLIYGGKKYYRYGAGQTPCYYELTDTELIVKNTVWSETETINAKLQLLSDGTLKVTYVGEEQASRFKVGDILSIEWNYLS